MLVSTRAMTTSVASLFLAVALTGCKSDQPAQTGYQPQPGYGYGGQAQQYPGTQPTAYPTATPTAATGAAGAPGAAAGTSCQAMDASAATAVQPLITALAASNVPAGAKPVGSVLACNFQQGQTLQGSVQMQPGKCYTVVGAGMPSVTQLDLQLVAQTPIPGMAPVIAQSNTQGSQAVIGKKPDCYKWAWPVGAPVNVVVKATAGSGYAAAQVYEK